MTDDLVKRRYSMIPAAVLEGLENYRCHHIRPGSFTLAVLENDLLRAIDLADYDSLKSMPDICRYVWHQLPAQSHGSEERVAAWLRAEEAVA
jgi:hypothetical protein